MVRILSCNFARVPKAWLLGSSRNVSETTPRAPSQYPKRRLSVRSRKVSKLRDLYLELSDRSEIWQALRQQCCRCACQISKRYDNLKYQSRGFETSRDLTIRRFFGYWDGVQMLFRYRLFRFAVSHRFPWLRMAYQPWRLQFMALYASTYLLVMLCLLLYSEICQYVEFCHLMSKRVSEIANSLRTMGKFWPIL